MMYGFGRAKRSLSFYFLCYRFENISNLRPSLSLCYLLFIYISYNPYDCNKVTILCSYSLRLILTSHPNNKLSPIGFLNKRVNCKYVWLLTTDFLTVSILFLCNRIPISLSQVISSYITVTFTSNYKKTKRKTRYTYFK